MLEHYRNLCRAGELTGQPRPRRWIRQLRDRTGGVWHDIQARTRPIGFSSSTLEAEFAQVELVDKYIDHPNWIVLGNVILQEFRQQRTLASAFTLDKSFHLALVLMRYCYNVYTTASVYTKLRFYTVWDNTGRKLRLKRWCYSTWLCGPICKTVTWRY